MKNSYLIWIPSIRNYLRFQELTNDQYRCLLKVIDDETEIEFFYHLNQILKDNLISDFDYNTLTTIDRFIICIYLKLYSCSPSISLSRVCDKCGIPFDINLDLNQLITNLGPDIDRSFSTRISFETFVCIMDIPSVNTEYKLFEHGLLNNENKKDFDNLYDNYILSHIRKLVINDNLISFDDLKMSDRKLIFRQLPAGLINNIKNDFLNPIHHSLSDLSFLNTCCPVHSCKQKFDLKFEITTISDLIKILFKDNSINSLLMNIFNLSSQPVAINPEFIMSISPMESNIMMDYLKQVNTSAEKSEPKQTDMFESPSEFS